MDLSAAGIYAITNKENSKTYIGSAVCFGERWYSHKWDLRKGTHHNIHLQRSWDKHGEEAFEFGILEYLDKSEKLYLAEQFWIDVYQEEDRELYNIATPGPAFMTGQKHTKESRQKMSEDRKGKPGPMKGRKHTKESRYNMSEAAKGREHTEKTKRKMSESHKGEKYALGNKHSEETKRKIGRAAMGNHYGLGYKHTKEAKRKMSKSAKKRAPHSEETKQKISEARIRYWENRRKSNV